MKKKETIYKTDTSLSLEEILVSAIITGLFLILVLIVGYLLYNMDWHLFPASAG